MTEPRDRDVERAYREASTETPPADLDARILAAAHREVAAHPTDAARPRHWIDRYRVPLSVAATALIAVTVSLMVEDETRRAPEADAPLSAPPAAPGEARKTDDAPWGSRAGPTERPAPPSDSAPLATRRSTAQPSADAAPAPPSAVPAPVPGESGTPSEQAPRTPPPAPPRSESLERADDGAAGNAVLPRGAPAAAAPGMATRSREVQERPSRVTRDEAGPAAERALPQAAAIQSPEAWLAEIRRLRAEGRLSEADVALASFRREYPDYPLPEDLRRP
jgi:Meckel syndrome type 1 protein